MKWMFTLLAIITLPLSIANAQEQGPVTLEGALTKGAPTELNTQTLAKRAPHKAMDLKSGEHMMGYYTTDDLPTYGYGMANNPGSNYRAAVIYDTNVTKRFVGGKITRFRYGIPYDVVDTPIKGYFICELYNNYNLLYGYDPIVEVVYADPITPVMGGWNEVDLDTPVEIKADKYYAIGYIYDQTSSNNPFATDGTLERDYTSAYGLWIYGNVTTEYGLDWYYFPAPGSLCVQAVVDGGDFDDYDISLTKLTADKYVQKGGKLNYSFRISNYGMLDIDSYTLNVEVDGDVVETLDTPIALTGSYQTYSNSITIPSSIGAGSESHSFKVYLTDINGNAPTGDLSDDTLESTFYVYTESVSRKKIIIEDYTSVYCGYCPSGHEVIEKVMESDPDGYTLVMMHGSGMGSDPFIVSYESYLEYFAQVQGYPYATFNRYIYEDDDINSDGYMAIGVGYTGSSQDIAASLIVSDIEQVYGSIPAFASVNITADYNEDTRVLAITVSGRGVEFVQDVLKDNVMNVYLVEDGIVGFQEDYINGDHYDYTHDDVLRAFVTDYYGDNITWNDDNTYSMSFTVGIDDSWVAENMKVVAFISGPMVAWKGTTLDWADRSTAYVNNCNVVTLPEKTGIQKTAISEVDATEEARYTVDGRKVNAPMKGLNIVRMSDGSVRKVNVK